MKKKNILMLLCDDFISEKNKEEEIFNKCINDFGKCIEDHIVPILVCLQDFFGYEFDLNSTDRKVREKSIKLLEQVASYFKKTVSCMSDIFLNEKKTHGMHSACLFIIFSLLMFYNGGIDFQ